MKKLSRRIVICLNCALLLLGGAFQLRAYNRPDIKSQPPSSTETLQELRGQIRVRKAFGVVPMGPGHSQQAVYPCGFFYVAVLDPNDKFKPLAYTDGSLEQGRDDGDYYICKYSLKAPANKSLYAIAGMGGVLLLPKEDRSPMYITDAWIGGTRPKPPFGHERGFVGKYVTLGKKPVWLTFEMVYARVDPN